MNNSLKVGKLISVIVLLSISCKRLPPQDKKVFKTENISNLYANLGFEMSPVIEPSFLPNEVDITNFGGINDGKTLNTQAFAAAIEEVSKKGGGKVNIPKGIWLTGPIILKSNINLHAEAGALVIFSTDRSLYPLIETSFEGYNTVRCISPIYGKNLENIAFTGAGVYEGAGDSWRAVKRTKLTDAQWKKLVLSGGIVVGQQKAETWYPSEQFVRGEKLAEMNVPHLKSMEEYEKIKDFLRPVMVSLVSCNKVLIDGPVFQNSPAWCLHPLMCENLTIRNIMVKNPWYSQNGDGIDIESCKNTILYNSSFDVGDDAICIKSGKNEDGRERGKPTENLIVKNCIVYHGHGGVTVGSEMSGGVKNMHVSNCVFMGTDVGLRFKTARGRGGVVENIFISDINMNKIPGEAISFNMYYDGKSVFEENRDPNLVRTKEKVPPVTEETPQFKNIHMTNIVCAGASQGILLQGLPEMNLKDIYLENINIQSEHGMTCVDAENVFLKNVRLASSKQPVIYIRNSRNVNVEGFNYSDSHKTIVKIDGDLTQQIKFKSVNFTDVKKQFTIGTDVNKEALIME